MNLISFLFFAQSNGFNYSYLIWIIPLTINNLFVHSEVVTSITIDTSYSIQHYAFIHTQLNGPKYCYVSLTSQLSTVKGSNSSISNNPI